MTTSGTVTLVVIALVFMYYSDKKEAREQKEKEKQYREERKRQELERKKWEREREARPEEVKAREREEIKAQALAELSTMMEKFERRRKETERRRKDIEGKIKLLISKFENMELSPSINANTKKASVSKWKLLLKISKLPQFIDMDVGELTNLDLKEMSTILDKHIRPWKYIDDPMSIPSDMKKEYLKSADWRKLKSKRLRLANNQCEVENCFNTKNLNLHHVNYYSLGNEDIDDLRIVCRKCHQAIHDRKGYERDEYYPI